MNDEAKRIVEALREDAEWAHANEWETPITLGDHLDEAADLIEKLTAKQSAWISVEERLPEPFKLVIVCRKYNKDFWKIEQGQLTVNGWWKVYGTNLKSVTHWMPLPEPPEE